MLVRSTPAGAQVSVNGTARGVTPLTVRNLEYGSYTVRVSRPGYAPQEQRVTITRSRPAPSMTIALRALRASESSDRVTTSAPFVGSLSVESRPAGATVFLNGRRVGETPMVLREVAAGSYALRLERAGYIRWSTSVRVVAGQPGRVTASLERSR